MPVRRSYRGRRKLFKPGILLKPAIALVAAWVTALLALAAGMPLLPVLVLALVVSAGVYRLLERSQSTK